MKLSWFSYAAILAGVLSTPSCSESSQTTYLGNWELNSRNDGVRNVIRFEETPSGELRFASREVSFAFDWNGNEHPVNVGGTAALRFIETGHWQLVRRRDGEVVTTDVWLGGREDTLIFLKAEKDRQGWLDRPEFFTRVDGQPGGLMGKWESDRVHGIDHSLKIERLDSDRLTLFFGHTTCNGPLNGSDFSAFMPYLTPVPGRERTCGFRSVDPRSLEVTYKLGGEPVAVQTFTASSDGQTLDYNETSLAVKDTISFTYRRQPTLAR